MTFIQKKRFLLYPFPFCFITMFCKRTFALHLQWERHGRSGLAVKSYHAQRITPSLKIHEIRPTPVVISSQKRFASLKSHSAKQGLFSSMSPEDATYEKTIHRSPVSKIRPPFRMPINSHDDSSNDLNGKSTKAEADFGWNEMGLWTELVVCLQHDMKLYSPTVVQQMVIPELLNAGINPRLQDVSSSSNVINPVSSSKHFAFLAATGSGKTLAYVLPLLQSLKHDEVFGSSNATTSNVILSATRPKSRPRAVILAPTRELCLQIVAVVKSFTHHIKLSATAVCGGSADMGQQKKQLDRPIDVVVATPGRLLKHIQEKNIVLSSKYLKHVVLDEMDTMLEQGFAADLRQILYPQLYHRDGLSTPVAGISTAVPNLLEVPNSPSIILTSATMTQTIQKMIDNNPNNILVNAKKHYSRAGTTEEVLSKIPIVLPRMKVLRAPGLHKVVPRLKQIFIDVANADKLSLLIDAVSSDSKSKLIMIFCNTANSCRAVEYALREANIVALSYHGELNSIQRSQNLQLFRQAGLESTTKNTNRVLVCTDLAARGLDVPQVDHVIMFDFPLNALDYLHRSGRTARGIARKASSKSMLAAEAQNDGKVTALVSKRDKVLANAIESAVQRGETLDGLSSRKSDYMSGSSSSSRLMIPTRVGAKRKQPDSISSQRRKSSLGTRTPSSKKSKGKNERSWR